MSHEDFFAPSLCAPSVRGGRRGCRGACGGAVPGLPSKSLFICLPFRCETLSCMGPLGEASDLRCRMREPAPHMRAVGQSGATSSESGFLLCEWDCSDSGSVSELRKVGSHAIACRGPRAQTWHLPALQRASDVSLGRNAGAVPQKEEPDHTS